MLETLTIAPRAPHCCIRRAPSRQHRKVPVRLTPITRAQASSGVSTKASIEPMPALLITTSRRPKRASTAWKAATTDALSATLQPTARPRSPSSATARAAASALMSAATTRAPSAAKRCTMASPMPWAAPVTNTTLSENFMPASTIL